MKASQDPGPPVVFLIHVAAVLDNWDPRVVDGVATDHHVITFDSRGVGARTRTIWRGVFRIATSSSIRIPDTARCFSSTRTSCPRRPNSSGLCLLSPREFARAVRERESSAAMVVMNRC